MERLSHKKTDFEKVRIKLIILIISIFLVLCSSPIQAGSMQTYRAKTYNGWQTIKVSQKVKFQIPPTMEIQSDEYKRLAPESEEMMNPYNLPRVVAQQKGLNKREPQAFTHYARVVLKIIPLIENVSVWGEKLDLTADDLSYIESISLNSTGGGQFELVRVSQHAKIVDVNNGQCVNIKYETRYANNPIVYNDLYVMFNGSECYAFLTMVRSTEYGYWTEPANDIRKIINTINISDGL